MTYIRDALGADPAANGAAPSVQKQLDAVLKDAGGNKEEALRRVLGPDAAAVLPKASKKAPTKGPGPAPHGGRKGAPSPKAKPTPRTLQPIGMPQPAHLRVRPDALTVAPPRSSARTWLIIGAVAAAVGGLVWYMRKDSKRPPERA